MAAGLWLWAWSSSVPAASLRGTALVIGLGLALLAWAQGTRWQEAAGWAALALIGQACSFQLLRVGPVNRLQLFYDWAQLFSSYQAICLSVVAGQALLVAWGIRRHRAAAQPSFLFSFSPAQVLVFLALVCFVAVPVSPATVRAVAEGNLKWRIPIESSKVLLGLLLFCNGAISTLLASAAVPEAFWNRIAQRWQGSARRNLRWWCALWVAAVSALLSWLVLERLPHIPDETAYLFQAKYISAGHLWLPLPPDPPAFEVSFSLYDQSRWFCGLPPGWPMLLAAGVWCGIPWLVNPLLGALACLLAHAWVRRLYGQDVADGTVLLLAASPWLLFLSASLMTHNASLVFALLALLAVERAREGASPFWGALAGFSCGALLFVRPLEAIVIAAVAGLRWLSGGWPRWNRGWRRLRLPSLAAALAGGLAMTALFLAYNRALTGDALRIPLNDTMERSSYAGANRLGFGPEVGNLGWAHLDPLPGHGPLDVLVNTNHNLYMVNFELFGWAGGSLLLVFLLLLCGGRAAADRLMWGLAAAVWAGMSLYWFSGGPDFGARYWYLMIVPTTVLTVRGAQEFAARWSEKQPGDAPKLRGGAGTRVWAFVVLASVVGLANLLPWRSVDKYKNYRGVRADVRWLEREHRFGKSLVFVRGQGVLPPWATPVFSSAFALNPPTFERDAPGPIYARDLGPESRERVQRYYADRPVWILADPTLTGGEFRVLEGPLPPRHFGAPYH